MQVILTKRVPKLGEEHDVVTVKTGYARNFLIPKGLATMATKASIARAEVLRASRTEKAVAKITDAKEIADKLKTLVLNFSKKARSNAADAKLYGSVAEKDVIAALTEHGIDLEESAVKMEHIKTLGEHEVGLHLAGAVDATVKVVVSKED